MARNRYQHPEIQRTNTRNKSAQRWFFRARVDALMSKGQTGRIEDRFYLGLCSEINKRDAEKKRDQILSEVINRPDVVLTSQVLFGQVLDQWSATIDVRDSTRKNYESNVNAHIRPQWGKVRMCDITPMAVQEWLIKLAAGCAEKSFESIRSRFAEIWKRAIFWRYTREVCPLLGMPKIQRFGKAPRKNTLPTLEQFHQFLYLLDEPCRSLVVVCTFTGLRISEAMALTVEQLNSESTLITHSVAQCSGKVIEFLKTARSSRVVPMRHMRCDIHVPLGLAAGDRPLHVDYQYVKKYVKIAAQSLEIDYPGFGCHTFRRMHNTMFRRAAGNTMEGTRLAMGQLGHGDQRTNDLYYVEGAEDVQRRAEVVGRMRERVMEMEGAGETIQ